MTNKMPLFEREVDKIVTDNSVVIAALNERIIELEEFNLGLANESCEQQVRISELENLLKKFRPCDEGGNGWDFIYNEGSEYLGEAVLEALKTGN